MKTLYYAHAYCMYGHPPEQRELKKIRSRFLKYRIVNPSRYNNHPEKLRDSMEFCLKLVAKCDIVAFSRILGKVTSGVGIEVNHALKLGKDVYEITPDGLVQRQRPVKRLSRLKSIQLYGKWRFAYGISPFLPDQSWSLGHLEGRASRIGIGRRDGATTLRGQVTETCAVDGKSPSRLIFAARNELPRTCYFCARPQEPRRLSFLSSILPTRHKLTRKNASRGLVLGAVHGRTASHGPPSGNISDYES